MDTSGRQNRSGIPTGHARGPARVNRAHYRPVRITGLLLILQVVGMVGIGAYEVASVDWEELANIDWEEGVSIDLDQVDPGRPPESRLQALALQLVEAGVFVVFFLPPALLMLLAGLGFLLLKRRGWLLAAIAQGVSLGVCLWLYAELDPYYVYPIMVYCILMIMYLNSHDVRVVFHSRSGPGKQSLEAPHGG
jgi:hypothetical protein